MATNSKNTQKKQGGPGFVQEAIAVAGLFAAVFLLLCLVSFSLPILNASSYTASGNWCGSVGHLIAWGLMSLLGASSFWFVALLVFFAVQFFSSSSDFERLPLIFLGSVGILVASSSLLGIIYPGSEEYVSLAGRYYPAGGMLGSWLAGFLKTYLGTPGAVLLVLLLLIFSLMIAVRFSPYFVGRKVLGAAYARIGEGFSRTRKNRFTRERPVRKTAPAPVVASVIPSVNEPLKAEAEVAEEEEDFQVIPVSSGEYRLPGIGLLDKVDLQNGEVDLEHYYEVSRKLEDKLRDFGISGKVEGISPGPVVTTYEFAPAPGIKITRIVSLADDLAMGLKAESVRIVGSIPGKAALGIEIPNPKREIVYIRDILSSETFKNSSSKLTIGLGKDVIGQPVVADLAKMPHLLIAGATGSGKSVGINAIICSILFRSTPDEVRFLLIDPKRIELSGYEDIPHLLHPVVVDPKMANRALQWAVREMERRYMLLDEMRVKSFASYNKVAEEKLPLIVIVVDELADLMMISSREVEESIARLAQMARAAGMHLILATQRPSVDVLTGLIKANFPTRISFKVFSKIDSRTILDSSGAEHLLGDGDLLFLPPGKARMQRIHGAYISEKETERVIEFLKEQGTARYDESVLVAVDEENGDLDSIGPDDYDEKYDEAVSLVCETGQASISMVQRRLRVGYNRAARMIEIMEKEGIVGPGDGSKPREVLARKNYV
ncbi:MAG: DNA translocase FtsK 4TM domain-containing protein [Deltaproteobacteria bacterium]|jgi:S-DNA-T family DNA segregation ATPase FtsK/SpoIIIE|nr:DNA translocase FtsK 4TM domain-containing protein [Deltaproteobacteria bacterium]